MNAIIKRFDRPRVLLPVIHCCTPEQVRAQADVCARAGADGVFLIDQGGMDVDDILAAAFWLGRAMEGFFVGVNFLGRPPAETALVIGSMRSTYRDQIGAIWSDDAQPDAWRDRAVKARDWKGLFFGGVAFKGQRLVHPDHYQRVAREAADAGVDVVTTSGSSTGRACRPEKPAAMREAVGPNVALALASGITMNNVGSFLPFVDAFLVASSLERSFGEFDAGAVRAMADQIHAWSEAA